MSVRPWPVMALISLTGCAGWQAVHLEPQSFMPAPSEMRVTRKDGWQAVIAVPRLENDTIRGVRAEEPYDSIAMAASQVRSVAVPLQEERRALTDIGVVLGVLAVFTGMMYFGGRAPDS